MTNDRRQQDFAERLKRIQGEQAGQEEPAKPAPASPGPNNFNFNPVQERHPIRNGLIWLIFLGVLGTGGYVAYQAIPRDVIEAVAGLAGIEVEGETDAEDLIAEVDVDTGPVFLDETATMSIQGPIWASPSVAHTSLTGLTLSDIASEINVATNVMQVGDIIPFARNVRCDLRQPLATETVANIRIENALLPAPIQAFSNDELIERLLEDVESVTQDGQDFPTEGHMIGLKNSIDVFVTDTTAPTYLVLQNMGPGVVWNVQVAPGAQVAHLAIIGSNYSGVILPTQETTFEGLLVSDFIEPYKFGDDQRERSCMIRPWRNPQAEWIGVQNAALGDTVTDNDMFAYTEGYEAYNRWYQGALDIDAGTNLVTARDAAHVLVGPAPVTPLQYRSLEGQKVHLMATDHMFAGDIATLDTLSRELHGNMLQAAIGGEISALNPAALGRNSQ